MTVPSTPYYPAALDALYSTFEGVEADDGGTDALTSHDPTVMSAKFVYKPFQDELLSLIDKTLLQGAIRVRNETGGTLTYTSTPLVYFSGFKNNVISGDAAAQLSACTLYGVKSTNSLHWRLFWTLTNSGTTRTFNIYRDSAKTILVAHGSRTGDGAITLTADNSSGITGTITVTYTADDTDSSNYVDCNLFLISKADPASNSKLAMAVLDASLANNTNGLAYGEQDVLSLDTSGASAIGSKVYASGTAGQFTFTDPGITKALQCVGFVSAKDATNGSIRFFPSRRLIERILVTDIFMNSVRKTADQTKNSTTTFGDDSELSIALPAAGTYLFRIEVYIVTSNVNGIKWGLNGPTKSAMLAIVDQRYNFGGRLEDYTSGASASWNPIGTPDVGYASLVGTIVVTAAGNLAFSWTQQTSDVADCTIKAGSLMEVRRVA